MQRVRFSASHRPTGICLPDGIHPVVLASPATVPARSDTGCIRDALARPVASPGLKALIAPTDRVAVIVDDITRPTPTALILPPILETLAAAGVPRGNIAIVIALGTHRPMTPAEIEEKIGAEVAGRYRIVNDPAGRQENMVYLGRSPRGVPAWVHQAVVRADVRIGVGMIVPHLDAGFGGGAKIVLPGVCGEVTVAAFHAQMADVEDNPLGVADTPLRLDLEDFVAAFVPLDFIVNVVPDRHGTICHAVAGDPVAAHRQGARLARAVYGVPVTQRYPVAVVFAHPHQIDLWQCTKALAAGELITRTGGHLILVADCPEGAGPHPHFADYVGMDAEGLRNRIDLGNVEDRCAAAEAMALCRLRRRIHIAMVAPGLAPETIERMGFRAHSSISMAVAQAIREHGATEVALLPDGGVALPCLPVADDGFSRRTENEERSCR